jgi:hypothetical protein
MRRSETMTVATSPEEARAACRSALSSRVWEIEEDGDERVLAHEWPWRVNCQIRPATIVISIETAAPRSSRVRLDASAPGFGPVVSRHLRNHLEALASAISR